MQSVQTLPVTFRLHFLSLSSSISASNTLDFLSHSLSAYSQSYQSSQFLPAGWQPPLSFPPTSLASSLRKLPQTFQASTPTSSFQFYLYSQMLPSSLASLIPPSVSPIFLSHLPYHSSASWLCQPYTKFLASILTPSITRLLSESSAILFPSWS